MEEVLLVGESLSADASLACTLERDGWTILRARSHDDAIATIGSRHPAIVIVDQRVGDREGLTLLKQVRATAPCCETILVAEGGEVTVAIEVLQAGGLDYLRRPIDQQQLQVALGRARERRSELPSAHPATLLVVDDHEPTRRRLTRVLEKEGYRVLSAADGDAALRIFHEQRVDLILADLRMPRMDGLSLLEATKGKGADIEVIVVTGYGDEDSVVGALRQGAINFLRKPVEVEQMLLAIQKALEYQTIRRSLAHRNRDVELMQELVVRLTRELELVVEAPEVLSTRAVGFLHHFVDALPLGILVADRNREVVYANQHLTSKLRSAPPHLSAAWLTEVSGAAVSEEQLDAAYEQALAARPGVIATITLSDWAFLIMTPIRLVRPDGDQRFVAVAVRGERHPGIQ